MFKMDSYCMKCKFRRSYIGVYGGFKRLAILVYEGFEDGNWGLIRLFSLKQDRIGHREGFLL